MFGIGFSELLIILIIILIIFGAGKLPQIGRAMGEGIKGFHSAVKGNDENKKDSQSKEKEDNE
ncbi:MAG: twin-arginine translocase TatA/TatE family subunit [bacterium]|nr:twin-arginine translocase TatA/TatE family subunit [bacterium]